ncbi:uncharacterized protein BX664DRAFT_256348, partial [Halteromyces radiatus]|uniref:uncharacterized protein n=1 Tax=Halteromyces radiatus TaxID=101107 RepID=UPI00221F1D0F
SMKRSYSNEEAHSSEKRQRCPQTDLLTALTEVLSEIRSTPSTGEISAELMETFKVLMLQIEELSSDETNLEGKLVKDETERCLESWLDDLVAQCEADGELIFEIDDTEQLDEHDELALALDEEQEEKQQQQEDDDDDDDEEIIVVDDDDTLDTHQIQVMA